MAELWELSKEVENAPENYAERWKLAKKLYMGWEYRLALDHLLVLKEEWDRKVNVIRYLAATYYRLGHYEEAERELHEALETWPEEIGLHEQLARAQEVSGKRTEAAETWEHIVELVPSHPVAKRAAERLREEQPDGKEADLHLTDSDSGIDLSPGEICPNCGAQNSSEFDQCWQCHASIKHALHSSSGSNPHYASRRVLLLTPEFALLFAKLLCVALFAVSAGLSYQLFREASLTEIRFFTSLWDVYAYDMIWSRVGVGIAALIAWPLMLRLIIHWMCSETKPPASQITWTGLTLGLLFYISTFLPPQFLPLALILPAAIALAVILGAFRLGFGRSLTVWSLHLVLVFLAGVLVFSGVETYHSGEFFNPVTETTALLRFASNTQSQGERTFTAEQLPLEVDLQWSTTGSAWLDRRAGHPVFTVFMDPATEVQLEMTSSKFNARQFYEIINEPGGSISHAIDAGTAYHVRISGPEEAVCSLTVTGLLPVQVIVPLEPETPVPPVAE